MPTHTDPWAAVSAELAELRAFKLAHEEKGYGTPSQVLRDEVTELRTQLAQSRDQRAAELAELGAKCDALHAQLGVTSEALILANGRLKTAETLRVSEQQAWAAAQQGAHSKLEAEIALQREEILRLTTENEETRESLRLARHRLKTAEDEVVRLAKQLAEERAEHLKTQAAFTELREQRDADERRAECERQEVSKGIDQLYKDLDNLKHQLESAERLAEYQHTIDYERLKTEITALERVRRRLLAYRKGLHDTVNRLMISGPGLDQTEADELYQRVLREVDAAGQDG